MAMECRLGDRRFGRNEHDHQRCHAGDAVVSRAQGGGPDGIAATITCAISGTRSKQPVGLFVRPRGGSELWQQCRGAYEVLPVRTEWDAPFLGIDLWHVRFRPLFSTGLRAMPFPAKVSPQSRRK